MRVVSNTSPILNLAIIGQLELLHQQFGELWIPRAVLEELRSDENLPGSRAIQDAIKSGWIKVEKAKDLVLVQTLEENLDNGEAESIALAIQLKAEQILLDERDGRKQAKRLGLNVTGVLGVLLTAQRDGKLSSLSKAIDDLQGKAAFRINPGLLAEIKSLPEFQDLKRVEEIREQYSAKSRVAARPVLGEVNLDDMPEPPSITRRASRIMNNPGDIPEPPRITRRTRRKL